MKPRELLLSNPQSDEAPVSLLLRNTLGSISIEVPEVGELSLKIVDGHLWLFHERKGSRVLSAQLGKLSEK